MRERQKLVIDRKTGDVTLATEAVDGAADFATRMRELRASVAAPQPGDTVFAGVTCDGCGTSAETDFQDPKLPPGWTATESGDFCPRCQSLN